MTTSRKRPRSPSPQPPSWPENTNICREQNARKGRRARAPHPGARNATQEPMNNTRMQYRHQGIYLLPPSLNTTRIPKFPPSKQRTIGAGFQLLGFKQPVKPIASSLDVGDLGFPDDFGNTQGAGSPGFVPVNAQFWKAANVQTNRKATHCDKRLKQSAQWQEIVIPSLIVPYLEHRAETQSGRLPRPWPPPSYPSATASPCKCAQLTKLV